MLRLPLPLLALTFVAALVAASHAPMGRCDARGAPALGLIEFTGGTPETSFYVDDRSWALGNGLWIYEESNGVWAEKPAGVHSGDATLHSINAGDAAASSPTAAGTSRPTTTSAATRGT